MRRDAKPSVPMLTSLLVIWKNLWEGWEEWFERCLCGSHKPKRRKMSHTDPKKNVTLAKSTAAIIWVVPHEPPHARRKKVRRSTVLRTATIVVNTGSLPEGSPVRLPNQTTATTRSSNSLPFLLPCCLQPCTAVPFCHRKNITSPPSPPLPRPLVRYAATLQQKTTSFKKPYEEFIRSPTWFHSVGGCGWLLSVLKGFRGAAG